MAKHGRRNRSEHGRGNKRGKVVVSGGSKSGKVAWKGDRWNGGEVIHGNVNAFATPQQKQKTPTPQRKQNTAVSTPPRKQSSSSNSNTQPDVSIVVNLKDQTSVWNAKAHVTAQETEADIKRFFGVNEGGIFDVKGMLAKNIAIGQAKGPVQFFVVQPSDLQLQQLQKSPATPSLSWQRPAVSASRITEKYGELYDAWGHVCGPETYIPSSRIRTMVEQAYPEKEIVSFQASLQAADINYVDTFRHIEKGSESLIVDLNLQAMLGTIVNYAGHDSGLFLHKIPVNEHMHLARAANPEHCLSYMGRNATRPVVVGSEVKAIEASLRVCYPQLLACCGSFCIELHRLGVPYDQCAVVGIAMAGSTCQFCAVYLLQHNFPVMVALTPPLTLFGTRQERRSISLWCLRFMHFGLETGKLLDDLPPKSAPHLVHPSQVVVRLSYTDYFPKPVRRILKTIQVADPVTPLLYSNRLLRLNHIMQMYESLRKLGGDVDQVILFPEGVVSVPGPPYLDTVSESNKYLRPGLIRLCADNNFPNVENYTPLILFPILKGWKTVKPPKRLRCSYIAKFRKVVNLLNEAGIAHLDQRPANIMWREQETVGQTAEVEIRLIDFEDAEYFGNVISKRYVEDMAKDGDRRYPFKPGDAENCQVADRKHNAFFFKAVRQWVGSDIKEFGSFMRDYGHSILDAVDDEEDQDEEDEDEEDEDEEDEDEENEDEEDEDEEDEDEEDEADEMDDGNEQDEDEEDDEVESVKRAAVSPASASSRTRATVGTKTVTHAANPNTAGLAKTPSPAAKAPVPTAKSNRRVASADSFDEEFFQNAAAYDDDDDDDDDDDGSPAKALKGVDKGRVTTAGPTKAGKRPQEQHKQKQQHQPQGDQRRQRQQQNNSGKPLQKQATDNQHKSGQKRAHEKEAFGKNVKRQEKY